MQADKQFRALRHVSVKTRDFIGLACVFERIAKACVYFGCARSLLLVFRAFNDVPTRRLLYRHAYQNRIRGRQQTPKPPFHTNRLNGQT